MAKPQERVFALIGAVLFLGTSMALSIAVLWQMHSSGKTNTNAAANTATQQVQCQIGQSAGEVMKNPEVFKPKAAVKDLQVADLETGSGQAAKVGDCLEVKYFGTLTNGKKFDANYDSANNLKFLLGKSFVIPGWDQGLVGMKVGGTRRLVIPPVLAYGAQAVGSIPANSTLVFVVKLVKIDQ